MSFRKRNVGLSSPSAETSQTLPLSISPPSDASPTTNVPGVRPSPVDGRPTTSTGTQSLDDLFGGHAGLALGNSLLIEEDGTTDFAGALLRFCAAEGVVQGHKVHVVGVEEIWGRKLPGLGGAGGGEEKDAASGLDKDKMKIAWRYERLGEFGTGPAGARAPPTPNRNPNLLIQGQPMTAQPFCHTFDLTKRLPIPPNCMIYIPIPSSHTTDPYTTILTSLTASLITTAPSIIHRLIIPSLLSPALYPSTSTNPTRLLPFLHSLRSLLRSYPTRLAAIITLPLSLHPRNTGLVRWIEYLCDGVIELAPFPHSIDVEPPLSRTGSGGGKGEDRPQGLVRVLKVPVVSEKGGAGGVGDDLAFSLGRRRFVVKAFSLPPVDGDGEAQRGEAEGVKKDIEF